MPNIRYIPGDPSDLLLRQTYYSHSDAYNNFYAYLSEQTSLENQIHSFKIIFHVVVSTQITNLSNLTSNIAPALAESWLLSNLSSYGIYPQLVNHDENVQELNTPGVNLVDGSTIAQTRIDENGAELIQRYDKAGVAAVPYSINGDMVPGVTLEFLKSKILPYWDPSKYMNIILVNSLHGLNSVATKAQPIPFHTENPLAMHLKEPEGIVSQAITLPFFNCGGTESNLDYSSSSVLSLFNYPLHNLAPIQGNFSNPLPLAKALYRFFGITSRSMPSISAPEFVGDVDETNFFPIYAENECPSGCFYLDGSGPCTNVSPVPLASALNEYYGMGSLVDCRDHIVQHTLRDFAGELFYGAQSSAGVADNDWFDKIRVMTTTNIDGDKPFIIKSLRDFGSLPLPDFSTPEPEPEPDPFNVTWDCSILGHTVTIDAFPENTQLALQELLDLSLDVSLSSDFAALIETSSDDFESLMLIFETNLQ